jgi:Uma2 family endonuclease
MKGATAQKITLTYDVPDADDSWELEEQDVPESAWHDAIIELLKLVLKAWAARANMSALVASNLALRWKRYRWKIGVDPDVAMYIPAPPEGEDTASVCTWQPEHAPPRIAVEVVSRSTATKDYVTGPEQYAASGTKELWVFDPKRLGPKARGGPAVLQLWRRAEDGSFKQLYRGDGPCQSPELDAWLVVTDNGTRLRIADDRKGARLWLTAEEQERELAELERKRSEKRAAELEAELKALRAELKRLRRSP